MGTHLGVVDRHVSEEFPEDPTIKDTSSVDQLSRTISELLIELRKLHHPAFEANLLEELRKQLLKQNQVSIDILKLLRDLDHDLQWLRKHVGSLHLVLDKIGIKITEDK